MGGWSNQSKHTVYIHCAVFLLSVKKLGADLASSSIFCEDWGLLSIKYILVH